MSFWVSNTSCLIFFSCLLPHRSTFVLHVNYFYKQMESDPLMLGPPVTFLNSVPIAFKQTKINYLVVLIPFAILSGILGWGSVSVFWLNFFAIIPLASLLGFATEELSKTVGTTIGGLLNATFGNTVELLVSIFALRSGMITVVQNSLLGSILSNLLLVLGFSFLCGGVKNGDQKFNQQAAQTSASLLGLTVLALIIPAALMSNSSVLDLYSTHSNILSLSRGVAIILLVMYGLYLLFQLKTHRYMYEGDEMEESPIVTRGFSIFLLVTTTLIVAVCSDYLVDSIEGISEQWNLPQAFVSLILLPIVGNAAEHYSAVTFALHNHMDLTLGIAIGSSMQISLFAMPLLTILGWVINQPMTLCFDTFETVMF
eukprot:NODE_10_length_47437_cov_0.363429.p12 type:complete len:370 gc:universal NODE_10_length_47437_cov_0.363429:31152-32261(+)